MHQQNCIATSIVLDDVDEATDFPSVGGSSASDDFQMVYWRCVALCLLTARTHNPDTPLLLFSNVAVETAAPAEIVAQLRAVGVTFVRLPLSYRLPKGSVSRWGNVFYVLDIIRYFVKELPYDALVMTDADCLWRRPVTALANKLAAQGCLLYSLRPEDQKAYEGDVLINGMSRRKMLGVLEEVFSRRLDAAPPHNGAELFAATRAYCQRVLPQLPALWAYACNHAGEADGIKTEEHLLNILAWANDVPSYGANEFIRRLWTNFADVNLRPADMDLMIWHIPAEKKFGFRRMWDAFVASGRPWSSLSPQEVNAMGAIWMGVPGRSMRKLGQDLFQKIGEKATGRLGALRRVSG